MFPNGALRSSATYRGLTGREGIVRETVETRIKVKKPGRARGKAHHGMKRNARVPKSAVEVLTSEEHAL
jgi:hypothetical protein